MFLSHHVSKHLNNVYIPNVLNLCLLLHTFHVTFNHNGTMKLFVHDYLHINEDEYTLKKMQMYLPTSWNAKKESIGTWQSVFVLGVLSCQCKNKSLPCCFLNLIWQKWIRIIYFWWHQKKHITIGEKSVYWTCLKTFFFNLLCCTEWKQIDPME